MRTLVLCLVFCSTAAAEIYIVPVVSAKYGDRFYSTSLLLRNPTQTRVRCEAVYAIPNDPEGGTLRATYDVAPGTIQVDEEALREVGAIGTLRMACSGPVEVAAQIRTSTDAIAFDAGRVFSGIEERNEIGATSPPWRTSTARDLAVMEVRGEKVVVLAFIRTAKGELLAEHSYTIPPFALQIVNLKDFRAAAASLELVVIGRGAVVIQTEGDAQSTQSSASIRSRGTGIPLSRNALAGLPAAFKPRRFRIRRPVSFNCGTAGTTRQPAPS